MLFKHCANHGNLVSEKQIQIADFKYTLLIARAFKSYHNSNFALGYSQEALTRFTQVRVNVKPLNLTKASIDAARRKYLVGQQHNQEEDDSSPLNSSSLELNIKHSRQEEDKMAIKDRKERQREENREKSMQTVLDSLSVKKTKKQFSLPSKDVWHERAPAFEGSEVTSHATEQVSATFIYLCAFGPFQLTN